MKNYSAKSSARRAAINELAKGMGLLKDEIKSRAEELFTIEDHEEGGFFWRRVQIEVNARCPMPAEMQDVIEPAPLVIEVKPEAAPAIDPRLLVQPVSKPAKQSRPRNGNVKKTWDICFANIGMKRKELMNMCVTAGINFYTARTQIQAYLKAQHA